MSDFLNKAYPVSAATTSKGKLRENDAALSVSEISSAIKATLESRFDRVRVRGEISGLKQAASGHVYLSLKDDSAVINSICWRGSVSKLSVQPEEGMEVIATGRISSYPGRSNYQLIVEQMEPAGQGALLKMLEERKKALAAEGLFAAERKTPLPFLPDVIGVVTSPTGAVIRDILHRLSDRFPRDVMVWPVMVQGDGAAAQVAEAIRGFNAIPEKRESQGAAVGGVKRPDLLIVARGGGSLEDLWAFNEERVVRAVAESSIPLISAVGHETDTTLIDFVSDRRAPTPTAAAEMAVPVRQNLIAEVTDLDRRLFASSSRTTADRKREVEALALGLPNLERIVEEKSQRLDDSLERLDVGLRAYLAGRKREVEALALGLPNLERIVEEKSQRLDDSLERLDVGLRAYLAGRKREVEALAPGLPNLERIVEEKSQRLDDSLERLDVGLRAYLAGRHSLLGEFFARLPHPRQQLRFSEQALETASQRLAITGQRLLEGKRQALQQVDVSRRLGRELEHYLTRLQRDLVALGRILESTSYKNVLKRGFSVVRSAARGTVLGAEDIQEGMALTLEFAENQSIAATAEDRSLPRGRRGKTHRKEDDGQASLF